MFKNLLADSKEQIGFIVGPAGSGKTHSLIELVNYCEQHDLTYCVLAYTHKACDVLRERLPDSANIRTLHSNLKKMPITNARSIRHDQVTHNIMAGMPEAVDVMFVDEFSMVGSRDAADIEEVLKRDQHTKLVLIGDLNQLLPIGDTVGFEVTEDTKYITRLTTVVRTQNKLQETLALLVDMLEGTKLIGSLPAHEDFIRDVDIVSHYKADPTESKVIAAYTRRRVQELNRQIMGYGKPRRGDLVSNSTTKTVHKFLRQLVKPVVLLKTDGSSTDHKKVIDRLLSLPQVEYGIFAGSITLAYVFGYHDYKVVSDELAKAATDINKAIKHTYQVDDVVAWCNQNKRRKVVKERAKAWETFMWFKQCVHCLDFTHAHTVHQLQGSTFDHVYVDLPDIMSASSNDTKLRLTYVAISRARYKVYTSGY